MSVKKSNGTPFSVWLGQLIIKVNNIPFKEWTQGYEDNLTIDETVKRYEERYGKTD
jgi:glucose dehydrogenase